jgi:GT2 family glycosyltransferase
VDLSVVIPTRDRAYRVAATLQALQAQQLHGVEAEVIVVDNADRTLELQTINGPLQVRLLREREEGAAVARNLGLRSARGEVVLFLGDDTPPAAADLLYRHVDLHRSRPEPSYAVLGRIDWDPAIEADDFRRWLTRAGFQSAFERLEPGPVVPARHFISSHASVKRSLLERVGGFDEAFPIYFEDVELGIRLAKAGVLLDYHPELLVHHDHPYTPEEYVARMEAVGRAAHRLRERWPEDTPAEVKAPEPKWALYRAAVPGARAVLRLPLGRLMRERAWAALMMAAYARGYRASENGDRPEDR